MKHNKIKAVFVDLDGTLMHGVDIVTNRTRAAFAKVREKGILPIICTGRGPYDVETAAEAIGADRYLISLSGLAVYRDYRQKKPLMTKTLPANAVEQCLELLLREKDFFFEIYSQEGAFCQADRVKYIGGCGMDEEHIRYYRKRQTVVPDIRAAIEEKRFRPMVVFTCVADTDVFQRILGCFQHISGVQVHFPCPHYMDVIPSDADKRFGVRAVCQDMGLKPEEIMAIGDSDNDLGMFEEAGVCVAMGNACEELKAKAHFITLDNLHDGVAYALEQLLL